MKNENRLSRLKTIITMLSSGVKCSTPNLAEKFNVSKKVIQSDFKDYLIPVFKNKEIYYNYSLKSYLAKNNFLNSSLFDAEELAVIAILKVKSKEKNCDTNLYEKVETFFDKFEDELSSSVYEKSSVEKIDKFKKEITLIKNAIVNKRIINCFYNNKNRKIYPLKILNLEGYWYLLVFDKKVKTFHLNTIKDIEVLDETYEFDENQIKKFDNAISAYFKAENKEILVQLHIDKKVARYFERKPLSKKQRVLSKKDDLSIEIEILISDYMEIIPTIQRYMPHIKVIEPNGLKLEVKKNIESYLFEE